MNKTITLTTKDQLEQYNQELQNKERAAKKDKYILLLLAGAGIIGVFALIMTSIA